MIRSIKRKTKWNRKARLNVESMLHIGEGKSVTIAHQPQYELDTYTISFFASVHSTFSIAKGAFSFTQADLPGLKLNETALITITNAAILKNGIYVAANNKIFNNQYDIVLSGDFLIGHLAIFNKEISQQEIEFIHSLGGVMPESSHASCVGHWPFTQRYGKTAWDVVEQYNYAKPDNLKADSPFDANWTASIESGGWIIDNTTQASFLRSRAPNAFEQYIQSHYYGISTGFVSTQGYWETIEFSIIQPFDGEGVAFEALQYDMIPRTQWFKDVGDYSLTYFVENTHDTVSTSRLRIIASATTTEGIISNLRNVRRHQLLEANNADLINFVHPWYANHQFNSNGYVGAQYSTMSTRDTVAGVTVNFATNHVEYLVNSDDSGNNAGLAVLPKLNVETGKTYVVEIDWEFFMNGPGISTRGVQILLGFTSGVIIDKSDTFSRTVETGEILCTNGGPREFVIRHKGGTYAGNSLKIYSIKIYEKNKQRDVDSSPTGVPDPATNTAWLDFYKKTPIDWIDSVDENGNIIEKGSGREEIKKGLVFNGVNQQLILSNPSLLQSAPQYSFGFAVKLDSTKTDGTSIFFEGIGGTDLGTRIIFGYHHGTNIFTLYNQSEAHTFALGSVDQIFTIGCVFENNTATFYFNGVKISRYTFINPAANYSWTSIKIGRRATSGGYNGYFKGIILKAFFSTAKVTPKDFIIFSNNSLLKNLLIENCLFDLNFQGVYDGDKLEDYSPNSNHFSFSGFSADQLNPIHADYAFKTINDLR